MKHQIGSHHVYILAILLLFITAEIAWRWKKEKYAYELRETLSILAFFAWFRLSKYLFAGYRLAVPGFPGKLLLFKLLHNGWGSRFIVWNAKKRKLFNTYINEN